MLEINESNFKLLVQFAEKKIKEQVGRAKRKIDFNSLRYKPEDYSISEKTDRGAYVRLLTDNFESIQVMKAAGHSHASVAERYSVSESSVRYFLNKYGIDINKDRSGVKPALKVFFSDAPKAQKEQAFLVIDKYLGKIAKEKYKLLKGTSYEDCLQNLRLKFFEIVDKFRNGTVPDFKSVMQVLNYTHTGSKSVRTVGADIENLAVQSSHTDFSTKMFEERDFCDYIIENSKISSFQKQIIKLVIYDGMSISDVARKLNMSEQNISRHMKRIAEKMGKTYETLI